MERVVVRLGFGAGAITTLSYDFFYSHFEVPSENGLTNQAVGE